VHLAALKQRATTFDLEPLDLPADDFAPYARAPAIVGERAYWISEGRLVRRALRGGELQVLASDARKRTRVVAAASPQGRAIAAYITQPSADGAAQGKLWIEPDQMLNLTEEGSGTSSIAVAALGNRYLISALDGRSGMTPLHARTLSFEGAQARLGPDVVAWVGASAQATTEVFSTDLSGQAWAFVPIEQDMSHFGLAQLQLGDTPRLDAPVHFLTYPNGTNSAPAAAGKLCDQPVVIYASPETADPKSSQVLLLSVLGPDGLGAADVVAKRGHFSEVSLAPLQNGGLIVYTASKKTWAVTARCRGTPR